MPAPCTVLIGAPDLLAALKERSAGVNGEVLTFADADAVRALEEIVRRRPSTVALERQFAGTPRGTALINRIKADPALAGSELRVVAHDSDYLRVLTRAPAQAPAPIAVVETAPVAVAPPAPAAAPLDQRGTRRAPRHRIAGDMNVLLDGSAAKLVDLSAVGAQVISQTVLKPTQRLRVVLNDEQGALRFNGAVAWASFEIPPGRGPQYRAGVAFIDANADAVGAFCLRHKQS